MRHSLVCLARIPKSKSFDIKIKSPTPLQLSECLQPLEIKNEIKIQPKIYSVPEMNGKRYLSQIQHHPTVSPENAKYYQIVLMRGFLGLPPWTRNVIKGLGLTKRHQVVWQPISPAVAGMILKIKELVRVDLVDSIPSKPKLPLGYTVIGNAIGKNV